jgi:DNA-binding SARP family transcriptional activator/Tfp pilus assembly protein PilF
MSAAPATAPPTEPAPWALQLLGPARLLRPGAPPVDLPDGAVGYLLALLGERGDWVTRDEVTALFWPEATAADAQRSLRVTLNRLRDRLAAWGASQVLLSEHRRLRWLPGSDVSAARAASGETAAEVLAGTRFAASLSFKAYPELAAWADAERRALHALAREGVLRSAASGSPERRAERAARQLAADPGDEAMLRLRLEALADCGRHADIGREFNAFDARTRRDLGLPASPALAQLAARLGAAGTGLMAAPAAGDTLVGREDDQARLQAALAQGRLVTLVGLGGVGKTRLARALADREPTALWLSLQDADSAAELPHRVLAGLGMSAAPVRDAAARAAELLGQRGAALLVLDNVEQLLAPDQALQRLLLGWLDQLPALRLLLTSREPLGLAAETVLHLRTLGLPMAGEPTLSAPAVHLLVAQARRVLPGFDALAHRDTLVGIARAVGGLPLALRLCAQWLRLLSPADVLAALQRGVDELDVPDGGSRGLGPTLQRSWDRLDAAAQQALAALSVFVSPFSADDAVQAGAAPLGVLARLLDLGLVEALPAAQADGPTRLSLHPLVRAFAAERLAADPLRAAAAHERHAQAVRSRLAPWQNWRRVDQRQALASLTALLPEALAAWRWALDQGRSDFIAETAPVLLNHHEKLGRWAEGIALFESAEHGFDEQLPTDRAALAALWRGRALLLYRDGRFEPAAALARRGLAAARALGHQDGIKANLNTLALSNWMLGHLDTAEAAATEARDLAAAEGDHASEAVFAGTLALLHKKRGHYAQAEASWRRALAVHREVGNWSSACVTLNNLGNLLRLMGQADEAVAVLDESLRLCDAYGFSASRPFALINLAQAHLVAGRPEPAEALALQALAEVSRSGERMLEAGTLLLLADMALRATQLPLAAQRLAPAIRLARALNEPANLLEGLWAYARWSLARGAPEPAARAAAVVRAHPQLHAELRDQLAGWAGPPLADGPPADLLVVVEQACAALGSADAAPQGQPV